MPPGWSRRCCSASVVPVRRQGPLVVLSAVEHADDRHCPRSFVYGIGNHGAPFVVGEPKARADVFTCHTTEGEQCQAPFHVATTASV